MFTLGAFVVIFDEQGRVLLCHRRDLDIWNLPGGGVESSELPTEAAIRETREETGLEIETKRLVGVYGKSYNDDLVFVFIGAVTGEELSATEEADQCSYFDLADLPVNTIPHHVERIQDAATNHLPPVFRRQTGLSAREFLRHLGNL